MTIYVLHSCDEHTSYNSFRLVTATTSKEKLLNTIAAEVDARHMHYGGDTGKLGADLITADAYAPIEAINNNLTYGHITEIED